MIPLSSNTVRTTLIVALVLVMLAGVALALLARDNTPQVGSSDGSSKVDSEQASTFEESGPLRGAVSADGILEHERRFQAIAEENGGNRAAGTPGYDASADYVAGELRDAGYDVTVQSFELPYFEEDEQARLEHEEPLATEYTRGQDFVLMQYSGSGAATAPVQPVDAGTGASTSGCQTEDFAGFQEGSVALLRRGSCTFVRKAENAEEAGASAAVIFNDGAPGHTGELRGTLGGPVVDIPVFGTSTEVGERFLAAAGDSTSSVAFSAKTVSRNRQTSNVIAETPGGDARRTVVVGAHLDSVPEGPGINDNGSGSATVLEIALQMSRLEIQPTNRVRFAFWGAEEIGLLGSKHYVGQLSREELGGISAYLNFDMVGSSNFVREVYEGSEATEDVFNDYFTTKGIEAEVNPALQGRSDHVPFAAEGIPTGGLYSGAEEIKTRAEAASYGGEAGKAHDPCYHKGCDDLDNVEKQALAQLSDAAAHATLTLAEGNSR